MNSVESVEVIERLRLVQEQLKVGWTQGAMARAKDGTPTFAHNDTAVAWSLEGACMAVARREGYPAKVRGIRRRIAWFIKRDITAYNDDPDRTQAGIIEMIDNLIKSMTLNHLEIGQYAVEMVIGFVDECNKKEAWENADTQWVCDGLDKIASHARAAHYWEIPNEK